MTPRQGCLASAVFRLYVCGLAVVTWHMGLFEGRSIISLIAATDEGYIVLWAMLACGTVGLLDVILNDFGLVRILRFEPARTYRHFGFSGLAFCYASLVFIAVIKLDAPGFAAYCLWNALLVVAFSLIDAHQRSKEATCLQACN